MCGSYFIYGHFLFIDLFFLLFFSIAIIRVIYKLRYEKVNIFDILI